MFEFLPFGRKKSADPLSGLDAATRWLSELPAGDLHASHDRVVESVARFNQQDGPLSAERLEALMHLDQHSRRTQEALCRQYLLNPRMPRAMESRLWNMVYAYYWEFTRGYHAFLMDYVARPAAAAAKPVLPLVTARAMHYFAMGFKWRYFRFERVDEKSWKRLHNLYRFAEFSGFERVATALYPDSDGRDTSCAEQYAQALMLDFLHSGSLFPRQMEMVSGWLCSWSRTLEFERRYDPGRHGFYVDLGAARGARRVRRPVDGDKCRYWGTHGLIALIEQMRGALRAGEIPARVGLGEDCRLPACLELLEEVARQWAPTVPRVRRRHERRRAVQMLEVVQGVRDVFSQIKADNDSAEEEGDGLSYEEMVDVHLYGFVTKRTQDKRKLPGKPIPQEIPRERWVMENESLGGYGATVDRTQDDWLRLGRLVGLKPERKSSWQVAVVRRLAQQAANLRYVGMEILAHRALAVTLRAREGHAPTYATKGADEAGTVHTALGIYVPAEAGNGPCSLIMEAAEYAAGRVFDMAGGGKPHAVRLTEILLKGDDWLQVALEEPARDRTG